MTAATRTAGRAKFDITVTPPSDAPAGYWGPLAETLAAEIQAIADRIGFGCDFSIDFMKGEAA